MNKSEIFWIFSRFIQRKVLNGQLLTTIKELGQLVREGQIKPQEIGYWMKEQGLERLRAKRAGKGFTTEYFLNKEGIEVIRKKNRIGVKCGYTCGWTGYYDMLPDEEFSPGSSSIIQRIGDPSIWNCMYCPECDRMDVRAHYNIEATRNIKKQKEKVAFTAREITASGGLVRDTGEGSFSGPGMLGVPDNLKGRY